MLALVLMDHALRHRAQCGDVICTTPKIAASAPQADSPRGAAVEDPEPDEA
jgi:chorismate synthase